MTRSGSRAFLGLLLIGAFALSRRPAVAQTTSAVLKGTVRTPSGQALADAVVQVRSEETGVVRTALTDAGGRYRIDLLTPGAWVVVAREAGGAASEGRRVRLSLQQTLELDFTLTPELTETVNVTTEAPLVDPQLVGGELRIGAAQLDTLPLSGRLVTDLALLDSSVKAAPPGNFYGEHGSVFVVNGQTGRSNSFLVDGLDNNDQVSGTTMDSFFSQQVIREFVVMTHQYAPEFGRASGGVLNIVTRRGTNTFGGSAFVQGPLGDVSSPGEFVSSLPPSGGLEDTSTGLQTGFSLGGPIKKDRAFYFLAYEHDRADVVTPYTGVGRDGVAGGWVRAPSQGDNLFFKTDFNLGASNFLMLRFSADKRSTADVNVGGIMTPEAGFQLEERDVQFAASLTSVISPDVINEARMLLGRSRFDQNANSDRPGVSRPSGEFGGNNLNSQLRSEDLLQLVDNLTWKAGEQTLKFGVDVTRSSTDVSVRFNPNGNFIYGTDRPFEPGDCGDLVQSNFSTDPEIRKVQEREGVYCSIDPNGQDNDGDGTVDELGLLYTYPQVYTLIQGDPVATLDDTRFSLFAQGSWQVTPRFLLDYGWRYDLSTFRLPASARVPSSIPNGGAPTDTDNLAPRLGFSWMPTADGKLVVHGGGGIFYDKLVLGFPAVAAITSGTQIGLLFPGGLTLELTENLVEQVGIETIKNALLFPSNLTLRFSTGTQLDTPYTVQYTLGAQRVLGEHGSLSVNAIRALGYHQALMRDLNPPLATDIQGVPVHRDPTVGSIAAVVTEGRAWYTGLDLTWRWQKDGLAYGVGYTWSEAHDLGADPLKGGIALPAGKPLLPPGSVLPPPSEDPREEYARTDADRRHRIVVSGQANLPFWRLGISGIVQGSTGVPFNVTTGTDDNLDGILSDRPRGVDRNTGAGTPLGPVNALRRENGLPEVGSLHEPNFVQVDLRVWKPILREGARASADVYVQVFNLFDHFNAGPIEGRVTSMNFGQPIGQVGPSRTLELGLKAAF